MRGGGARLLPRRRAYDILVRNRFVIALLLALKIQVANAERAGAIIDTKHAAFLLVTRRHEPIVAGLLLCRAVTAAIAGRDAERARADIGSARIVSELARDDVAGQFIKTIDQRQVNLRRGEELVLAGFDARRKEARANGRKPETLKPSPTLPTSANRKSRGVNMAPSAFTNR